MAPPKKYKTVNNRLSSSKEILPDKDVGKSNKSRRKETFSGLLGSQWSKGELQRFYEAYRKFGTKWKKVAAVIRKRSVVMVKALYNLNRAYLSLPEGTASVDGFIAMMTDRYNFMMLRREEHFYRYPPPGRNMGELPISVVIADLSSALANADLSSAAKVSAMLPESSEALKAKV